MSKMAGFKNSAIIMLTQVGIVGKGLEEMMAVAFPDATTTVDRETRERQMNVAAQKLAEQLQKKGALENDLSSINKNLAIKRKTAAMAVELAKDPTKEQPSPEAKKKLVEDIKDLTRQAELREAELSNANTAVEFFDHLVKERAEALQNFDAEKRATEHRMDMARFRLEQAEAAKKMNKLAEEKASNSGLGALNRAAEKMEAKAKAAEIVNDATGNMLNQDPVMAKILAEAEHGPAKSVDDELAALASA